MHLLSSGKVTVLSDFADLETKFIYKHENGETTDFQFCAQQKSFVEINKKSGLEILRIKETPQQKLEIQRVRKLKTDNVYCVGCAKQSIEEVAVGLSNGHVKLYNLKNSQYVHRFQADNVRNTVLFLDYNCTDEYISSVLESGQLNIYGTKTKTKIDTFNIDNNSTLARFHPSKRFQLSIASYKGAVTLYDVQAKRKIFNANDAHGAPCRDLCMCTAVPSALLSVGYDCAINIFDTRHKAQNPHKITYMHPLSTVSLSDCGTFFCVGNLKGELITYDMRQLKYMLATKKVHDGAVMRIAFVPTSDTTNAESNVSKENTLSLERNVSTANAAGDLRKSIIAGSKVGGLSDAVTPVSTPAAVRGHRDSFCDFLDLQTNKVLERLSSRFPTNRRDSFDWETLARKPSNEDTRNSLFQMGSGLSSIGSASSSNSDSFEIKSNVNLHATLSGPLRDRSNNSNLTPQSSGKLMQIQEENTHNNCKPEKEQQHQDQDGNTTNSDKENPINDLDFGSRLRILPANRNSTPHHSTRKAPDSNTTDSIIPMSTQIANQNIVSTTSSTDLQVLREEMNIRFEMLNKEIDKRFKMLETEILLNAESNKWQMFTQMSNVWNKQIDQINDIRDGVGMLMRNDHFVNHFERLDHENGVLKKKLKMLESSLPKPQ